MLPGNGECLSSACFPGQGKIQLFQDWGNISLGKVNGLSLFEGPFLFMKKNL